MKNDSPGQTSSKVKSFPKNMLSVKQVAQRLGVSLSFVHKLVRSGEMESYQFGSCRRVSEEQLRAYIDDCVVEVQDDVTNRPLKHF